MRHTVVMYGLPPQPEPRPIDLTPLAPISPYIPTPALVPCPKCRRHIYGTECPFCHAESVAKPVGRRALEEARDALKKALEAVEQALAKAPT